MNHILIASILSMVFAQIVKVPIYYYKKREFKPSMMFSTGSMPSSHTAFVVTMVIMTGSTEGLNSPIFSIASIFALITIHDAVKVRGESGKQAKIVNQLVSDFTGMYEMMNLKTPVERTEKLKELIGHTTAEVFGGLITGIIIALMYISTLNI
jgi:acid phosphatase family membrane protein YuiD